MSDTAWSKMVDAGVNPDEEIEKKRKKRQDQLDAEAAEEIEEDKQEEVEGTGAQPLADEDSEPGEEGSDDDYVEGKSSKKKSSKR